MNSFSEVYDRIKEVTDIRNQTQLAFSLGLSPPTITEAKKRGVFPAKWMCAISLSHDIDLNYLNSGGGDRSEGGPRGASFKERLKYARVKFGSQQKLADAVGVSRQTINTWETNPPKRCEGSLLNKIAQVLKVDPRHILYGGKSFKMNGDVTTAEGLSRCMDIYLRERDRHHGETVGTSEIDSFDISNVENTSSDDVVNITEMMATMNREEIQVEMDSLENKINKLTKGADQLTSEIMELKKIHTLYKALKPFSTSKAPCA